MPRSGWVAGTSPTATPGTVLLLRLVLLGVLPVVPVRFGPGVARSHQGRAGGRGAGGGRGARRRLAGIGAPADRDLDGFWEPSPLPCVIGVVLLVGIPAHQLRSGREEDVPPVGGGVDQVAVAFALAAGEQVMTAARGWVIGGAFARAATASRQLELIDIALGAFVLVGEAVIALEEEAGAIIGEDPGAFEVAAPEGKERRAQGP